MGLGLRAHSAPELFLTKRLPGPSRMLYGAGMAHEELLAQYSRVADTFTNVLNAVPADKWSAVSPCEGWSVRDVAAHAIGAQNRWARGAEATNLADDADPIAAWTDVLGAVNAKVATPGALDAMVDGPMGPMPAVQMLGMFMLTDLLTHSWDISKGAGIPVTLDAEVVEQATARLLPMDAMIRRPGAFGPKVEAPEGSDAQTALMAFLGRQVA
jgi:uncharacterized protein (TIGR03086 family)